MAAAKARLDAFVTLARRAKEAGPPCSSCRYKTLSGMCSNPAYAEQSFEPSTGDYSEVFNTPIAVARSEDGLCGPEALLFDGDTSVVAIAAGAVAGIKSVWLAATAGIAGIGILAMLLRW